MRFASESACPPVLAGGRVRSASRERICRKLLWTAISAYVLSTLPLTLGHLDRFAMMAFDLGIFDQAAWLLSQGQTPFVTVQGLHILGDHFSAIVYLLAPLYWLWDSPKVLLTAQTVALALGALPVYALASTRTRSPFVSLLFAVCYLLYPALQWSNLAEFHPDTFATPLLLGALSCLSQKRWRSSCVLIGLAILTKETVGLTVMALGLYMLPRDRWVWWLTFGAGATALLVAMATVRHYNGGESSSYLWLYAKYGRNPIEIVSYLLGHPSVLVSDLTTEPKRHYLFGLLQPVMFLPLLSPKLLLVAAPALLTNLLSSRDAAYSLQAYHGAAIIPIVFAAAIEGYARIRHRVSPSSAAVLAANLALWALVGSWHLGPLGKSHEPPYGSLKLIESTEARQALAMIRPDTSVSAQSALVPHLSHRKEIYTFPNPFVQRAWGGSVQARREIEMQTGATARPAHLTSLFDRSPVEYIVLCPSTLRFPLSRETFADFAEAAVRSRAYGAVYVGRSVLLLKRRADHLAGLRLLETRSGVRITDIRGLQKALVAWMANQPMSP